MSFVTGQSKALYLSLSLFSSFSVDIRRGEFSFKPLICNYSKERRRRGERKKESVRTK